MSNNEINKVGQISADNFTEDAVIKSKILVDSMPKDWDRNDIISYILDSLTEADIDYSPSQQLKRIVFQKYKDDVAINGIMITGWNIRPKSFEQVTNAEYRSIMRFLIEERDITDANLKTNTKNPLAAVQNINDTLNSLLNGNKCKRETIFNLAFGLRLTANETDIF